MPASRKKIYADPFLDEVRALKLAVSSRFGNDVRALGKHAQAMSKRHPRKQARVNRIAN